MKIELVLIVFTLAITTSYPKSFICNAFSLTSSVANPKQDYTLSSGANPK